MTPSSNPGAHVWICVVALLAAASGCGTPAYTDLLNHRLDELRAGAPFRVLYGPTRLPDTPIQVRLPQAFRRSFVEISPHPDDGERVRADRIQPPFLKLDGFRMCYEGRGNDPNAGVVNFYCYLWAIPSKAGEADKIAADIQTKLNDAFKESKAEWQSVDAATPDGKALSWRKIRVEGPQKFAHYRNQEDKNNKASAEFPAIFELWMFDTQEYVVLIGWRSPTSVVGVAAPSKDPLELLSRPNQDKLDLENLPILTAGSLVIAAPEPAPAQ